MSEEVLTLEQDGAVAVVTMNRPKVKNALSQRLVKELGAALVKVAEDTSVRAVVLTGAGGAFCAGADLKSAFMENPDALQGISSAIDEYHSMIRAIVGAP